MSPSPPQEKQELLGAFEAMFSSIETNMGLSWSEKSIKRCMFSTFFNQIYLRHQGYTIFCMPSKAYFLIGKMMIFTGGRGTGYHSWPDSDWLDAPCDTSGFSSRPGFRETS